MSKALTAAFAATTFLVGYGLGGRKARGEDAGPGEALVPQGDRKKNPPLVRLRLPRRPISRPAELPPAPLWDHLYLLGQREERRVRRGRTGTVMVDDVGVITTDGRQYRFTLPPGALRSIDPRLAVIAAGHRARAYYIGNGFHNAVYAAARRHGTGVRRVRRLF